MKDSPPEGVEGTGSVSAEINDAIKAVQELDLKIEKLILQYKNQEILRQLMKLLQQKFSFLIFYPYFFYANKIFKTSYARTRSRSAHAGS